MTRRAAVTGGAGFVGSALVRRLVRDGWSVRALDDGTRGDASRIADLDGDVELHEVDVRVEDDVRRAIDGCEVVFHLAAVNGTSNFYAHPELVLDVGVRGVLSVVAAARSVGVPDLVVASSAEVYQSPPVVPTPETVAMHLPDPSNPRYSYAGSKIITELVALHYGRDEFRKVQVFRPHNVYGPDMGWKHVIPELVLRALRQREHGTDTLEVVGTGRETRAFAYVDDVVDGVMVMYEHGADRGTYHVGTEDEITIADLAEEVCRTLGVTLRVVPSGVAAAGGTHRRCPDLSKLRGLGYEPRWTLGAGLAVTCDWYARHHPSAPEGGLR